MPIFASITAFKIPFVRRTLMSDLSVNLSKHPNHKACFEALEGMGNMKELVTTPFDFGTGSGRPVPRFAAHASGAHTESFEKNGW